ncbi:MAG: glutathione binding-like protein, partial [Myxococcota bacterium]
IERTHYTYWLHYAEGSMMPPLLIRLVFSRLSQPPVPLPFRPFGWMVAKGVDAAYLGAEINRHMDFMNTTLANQPWFVGDNFTAADIQMSFPLLATQSHLGKRPHIKAFLKRCQQRPAFKKAISKGGPITPV